MSHQHNSQTNISRQNKFKIFSYMDFIRKLHFCLMLLSSYWWILRIGLVFTLLWYIDWPPGELFSFFKINTYHFKSGLLQMPSWWHPDLSFAVPFFWLQNGMMSEIHVPLLSYVYANVVEPFFPHFFDFNKKKNKIRLKTIIKELSVLTD